MNARTAGAGLRVSRRSRQTGHTVSIYNAEEACLDGGDHPWFTVCEEHGSMLAHRTYRLAVWHLGSPRDWCEDCREEHE
jgi:hypothetical protein